MYIMNWSLFFKTNKLLPVLNLSTQIDFYRLLVIWAYSINTLNFIEHPQLECHLLQKWPLMPSNTKVSPFHCQSGIIKQVLTLNCWSFDFKSQTSLIRLPFSQKHHFLYYFHKRFCFLFDTIKHSNLYFSRMRWSKMKKKIVMRY
jgi:hypothetical protein